MTNQNDLQAVVKRAKRDIELKYVYVMMQIPQLQTILAGLEESQKRVEEYKDAVESLYQIIQRGDLTSFDLRQADDVLDRVRKLPNEKN